MNARIFRPLGWLVGAMAGLLLVGCAATSERAPYDYSAYKQANPASVLVLPPLNESPDVTAPAGVLAGMTRPLAERGYYVLPVAVVDKTFQQNGITTAHDAQEVPVAKLREIFGADAALYLKISAYGASYKVLSSESRVTVEGRLVDLKTGNELWSGSGSASSAEGRDSGGGLLGMLITAAVNQIADHVGERSVGIAEIADGRLVSAGAQGGHGLLYGPYSPRYGTDGKP